MSSRSQRRKLERDIDKGKRKQKSVSNKDFITSIKYKLNDEQQDTILKKLKLNNHYNDLFNSKPKSISELRKNGATKLVNNINKEIIWYTKEIIDNSDLINNYLNSKDIFEKSVIQGDYDNASSSLLSIEALCYSEWFIENTLLLAEYSIGFKKNKEITSIFLDDSNNSLINLIIKYLSIKVEKDLSYIKYDEIIDNLLRKYNSIGKDYLIFKLNFFNLKRVENLSLILNLDNSLSVIDKYENLIKIFQILMSTNIDESLKKLILQKCKIIYQKVKDFRVRNILVKHSELDTFTLSVSEISFNLILDKYSKGNYEEVIKDIQILLLEDSNVFINYILYCKALLYANVEFNNPFKSNTLGFKILESTFNIISKNKNLYSSILSLNKIISSLSFNSINVEIYSFLLNESNSNNNGINFEDFCKTSSKYITPLILDIGDNNESTRVYNNISNVLKSVTLDFYYDLVFNNDYEEIICKYENRVDSFRIYKLICKKLNIIQDFENLNKYLNRISTNENNFIKTNISFNKIEITNFKITCLLIEKDYNSLVSLIAEVNIGNNNLSISLKYKEILKLITSNEISELKKNIATSIVLFQYKNIIDENEVWIALDNFLTFYEVNSPSELKTYVNDVDKRFLIFFLKNICVQDIYDSSIWFDNQEALDAERIEVLSYLSEIDKENIEDYFNEISEIDKNILIREGIKQIDESKIYVDTIGLKNSLFKDIEESLQRSLKLQNLSLDQIDKLNLADNNIVVPYFEQTGDIDVLNTDFESSKSNIKITSYSRFQHFCDMFYKIRDNFIANNEFGLDTYLSMRIRHGTLIGELRSVFENHFLITKKDSSSENYMENIYWKKAEYADEIQYELDIILANFSNTIDTLSNHFKNEVIQIKTELKKSEGYFDYSYLANPDLLLLFRDKFGSISETNDFIDEVINELWIRTEQILNKIRSYISKELESLFITELINLNKKIDALFVVNKPYELMRNITTCQTELRNELEKISLWFRRSNNKSINDFQIEIPIYLTITTIKRLYKEFDNIDLKTEIEINCDFKGEYFQHFCYIFQNLIHNILEHSNLDFRDLRIKIKVEEIDNNLHFIFCNNINMEYDLDSLNKKLRDIQEKLDTKSPIGDIIREESGTGYFKIQKTITYDLKCKDYELVIDDIDDKYEFVTKIIIKDKHIYKYEDFIN